MNKKNITINTDFFDQGNEAKLIESSQQNTAVIQGKQVTSRVDQYQNHSMQNSLSNYRYEIMPDNEYIYEQYHNDGSQQVLARKLHSANEIQNILSRVQARLFIAWWEELITKLHQLYYSSQEYKSIQQAQKQEIMQDYNNVFNNQNQQLYVNQTEQEIKQNIFASRQNQGQSIEDRKREVIERQKRGITLDSLEKLKSNRSKSLPRHQTSKEATSTLKPNHQSKDTFINEQADEKSGSKISRKSYRDKFIEYKHRSKSKQPGMPKSQTYTKFVSYYQPPTTVQPSTLNRTYTSNKIRNVQSATNIQQSKNEILRNINHLLMDRQDIYQGDDYRYYINHRDSSKHIFTYDTNSYHNYPGSSYSRPVNRVIVNQQLTQMQSTKDDEMQRARLIEEIVEKLKYSKIRLEEISKKEQNNDQLEMMRKLNRLEKAIMELKTQNGSKTYVKEPEVKTYQKSSEQQLYKKFVQQMATIKAQINIIKTLRQSSPHPTPQPQQIIVDNSSSHIIAEQQKLLLNYQRQYERLQKQKEKVVVVPKKPEPLPATNDANQSLLGQLIETGKNTTNKVGWDDGWETKEEKKEISSSTNINQFSNQTVLSKSVYRNAHLNRQDFDQYRYTRRHILEDIGMRGQVQEQERIWRETQARNQLDRERREIEVREMTEKVKLANKSQPNSDGFDQAKTIRQRHEENWEKYQKQRIDIDEDINKNFFCQLFPCK